MGNQPTATASARSGGIGVFGLAFIVMLVFKLADKSGASWGLDIPWLVVFLPVIISVGLFVLALVFLIIAAILAD